MLSRPVGCYSKIVCHKTCNNFRSNNHDYDRELLAIVVSMKQWRHHLEGARHNILITCDHKFSDNEGALMATGALGRDPLAYDFQTEH
jgi:hypothetical protein